MIPFYIGTYTSGDSRGIHRAVLNLECGGILGLELVAVVDNPTFLTLHPTLPILYCTTEVRRDGQRSGAQVMAYGMGRDGRLNCLGGQPTGGSGPCYVSTDRTGRVALVANYSSGSVSSFPIASDGSLAPMTSHRQHAGHSVNPERQAGPHAHCIVTDPSNRFACAVDLGLDQVIVYGLDTERATLSETPASNYHAARGLGPRHLAFHPDGHRALLIHEMGNALSALAWDAQAGCLTELTTVPTLAADFVGENTTAEVLVHPSGKYVYGSNRGHDSLAVYRFDSESGALSLIELISSRGRTPRNFQIDPTGQFLLVENQDTNSIVVFKIDPDTGRLNDTGHQITVGNPCCIKFVNG